MKFNLKERPLTFAALKSVQRRVGEDRFPLLPQSYSPSWRNFQEDFPINLKVSNLSTKMTASHRRDFFDISSILALHKDYYMTQKIVNGNFEISPKIPFRIPRNFSEFSEKQYNTKFDCKKLEKITELFEKDRKTIN